MRQMREREDSVALRDDLRANRRGGSFVRSWSGSRGEGT